MTNVTEEFQKLTLQLLDERQRLLDQVRRQQEIIDNYEAQTKEWERLVLEARAGTRQPTSSLPRPLDEDACFMKGTWLRVGGALAEAEEAFAHSESPRALSLLAALLADPSLTDESRVLANVFQSVIERSRGDIKRALACVNAALGLAQSRDWYELTGVAWFHRGLALFHADKYYDASLCFSLASHTSPYHSQIQTWQHTVLIKSREPSSIDALSFSEFHISLSGSNSSIP